ncbi:MULTISPECIES: hypothetical protein [Rhodococcus]|uniref:hypothetical protein n=1 Tax=Rhodococcus TaxID=1827 RepID=UPI00143E5C44|nr:MULTISPECIES: hypothetical protein [Rhodococcus]QIX48926.1 hypothetical protein HFP48_04725 [Rhodococcus sp. DMU1]QRI76023.1 hypothetical protein JQ505_26705 [Rhodococcus aetherivorans]QSE59434.1 hypothetical protein JYA75_27805 [Rhodococcus sp. PSBB066]QSE69241.1 hypothetical protein JYA91_27650 [Rhodococcus sp. PSBB049]
MTELDRPTRARLLTALDNIATWLADELDTTIAKLTAQPDMVGGPSADTPLPINADAFDAALDLTGTLDDWINQVCLTHHQIAYPGRLRIQPAATWLYDHYLDLARHERIQQAAREIIEAHDRVYHLVEQKRDPAWKQADPIAAAATELNPSGLETLGRELGGDYSTLTRERVESLRRNGHITPVRAIEGIGNLYNTGDVLIAHLTIPMRKRKRAA